MQMQQIIMRLQQNKGMTNGVIYNVYMLHVMTFQSLVVFILMDLAHSMKDLMLQHVYHMVEHLVRKSVVMYQDVLIRMLQTIMQMQM